MTTISKNIYIDVLNDIVNKYNNTVHRTIKIKPVKLMLRVILMLIKLMLRVILMLNIMKILIKKVLNLKLMTM